MNCEIRPADTRDIPLIYEIAARIWRIHYPSIISHEQIDYMLHRFYSPEALTHQMQNGDRFYMIAVNGINSGYLSESSISPGNYFLHKFYIDPALQGKGLGKYVFNSIFNAKKDLQTVRLNVNRLNYKSINFYFRLGFFIEKTTDIDIGDGYFMNDFIMLYKSNSVQLNS